MLNVKAPALWAGLVLALAGSCYANAGESKRRGPPPQAFEACADLAEGAACGFDGRRGEVTGTCFVPPRGEDTLVCAPEDAPGRGGGERPEAPPEEEE